MAALIKLPRPSPFAFPGGNWGFDPSHVAAGGALFSAVANGVNFNDIISGQKGVQVGTSITYGIDGKIGPSVLFPPLATSSTAAFTFGGRSAVNYSAFTIAAIFIPTTVATRQVFFSNCNNQNGVSLGIDIPNPSVTLWNVVEKYSGQNMVAGVPYFMISSQISTSVLNFLVMRLDNGSISMALVTTTGTPIAGNGTFVVGNSQNGGMTANAKLAAVMYSGVGLTMSKLLQWAQDPWSFWYP